MNKILALALALIICLGVGFAGHYFVDSTLDTWYPTLVLPSWTPPNWLFAPVWTILYITMGFSLWLLWIDLQDEQLRTPYILFGAQLLLNGIWPYLFFGLKSPFLGLINLVILDIVLTVTIVTFWKYSKGAALMLIPYQLWLIYALFLNLAIWLLNQ